MTHPNPILTLALTKKYIVPNMGINHLARNSRLMKNFESKIPALIPGLVNGFRNLPTNVNNIKMDSARFSTVFILTPLMRNDLLNDIS